MPSSAIVEDLNVFLRRVDCIPTGVTGVLAVVAVMNEVFFVESSIKGLLRSIESEITSQLSMTPCYRTFARSSVSTKPGVISLPRYRVMSIAWLAFALPRRSNE